jgi:cation diffusion facilitator CzcD-associated flavoprotein CzcO
LGLTSFTIFETNKDVGGTWLTNTYPGCACDVRSHLYSYSFELNPDWSESYSPQPEIWQYIKKVAQKYDLYPHIKFETEVKSMSWVESKNQWKVVTVDKNSNQAEEAKYFDIVINGPGALRLPNVPEQFKSFKGPMIHSAEWDPTVDLDNKIVGIIGSGASAVQIIPSIVKNVKELHVYQRKPAYVIPRPQTPFSKFTKAIFFYFPFITWLYRCFIFLTAEFLHPAFKKNSWMSFLGTKYSTRLITSQLPGRDDLQKQLTPKFSFGCKRLLISSDYYPALGQPHVKLHSQPIKSVEDQSILTEDGHLQKLDVLILATGYRVHDYFGPMQIYDKNGDDVLKSWKSTVPMTYYGIVSSGAPNHFILLGPNTALGHNTVVYMIECQVNFSVSVIREMMKRDAKYVCVKKRAEEKFMNWIQTELKDTVWGGTTCGSWYANDRGVITTLWPENCISYWNKTKNVNFSHFEFN